MESFTIDADTTVRPLESADAPAFFELINSSRTHLDRWLRWSSVIQTREQADAFVADFVARRAAGKAFHNSIWHRDTLAGGVICWHIDRLNRHAEIGYWLGPAFLGYGLATRVSARVISHLFRHERMHRVEMQCAVDNVRSRAVPERLGFTLEGVRRSSHWITDRFVDHAVYGILAFEWKEPATLERAKS